MQKFEASFQIGKQGIVPGTIETLTNIFKTHRQIRISVLKSTKRDKPMMIALADELVSKLPLRTGYKTIGFTIILRKLSSNPDKILKTLKRKKD